MTWTPDMMATVRENVGRLTAGQIGRLVHKSKNAVLGKIHRMGLSGPPNDSGKGPDGDVSRHQRGGRPPGARNRNSTTGCQWLLSEPRERNFCGLPRRTGSSYCEKHYRRSIQPGSGRGAV